MRQKIEQEKEESKKEQLRSLARWPCVAGPSLGPASPTPPPPFSPGHCRSPAGTYSSILLGAGFLGPLSCPSVGGGGGGGLLGCVPIWTTERTLGAGDARATFGRDVGDVEEGRVGGGGAGVRER
jgi:hypothetical protein